MVNITPQVVEQIRETLIDLGTHFTNLDVWLADLQETGRVPTREELANLRATTVNVRDTIDQAVNLLGG